MASQLDEKHLNKHVLIENKRSRKSTRLQYIILSLILILSQCLFVIYRNHLLDSPPHHHHHHNSDIPNPQSPSPFSSSSPSTFNWTALPSLPHLAYVPCYNSSFQCARLSLPMDYWNASGPSTISLAILRSPARVPVTHPRYGGAVLINPGGPGGSGVQTVLRGGKPIRDTIDSDDDDEGLLYDIIGFDPRGTGFTTPRVHCSASTSESALGFDRGWQLRVMEEGVLGSSDAGFGRLWAMADAKGRSCSVPSSRGEVGEIREFVGTAYVARDMLEVVEAHGRWREEEGKKQMVEPRMEVWERVRWRKGEEKLQYWGFSYGTYLGMTFAAMFPDRVRRIVVDGVVDAEDYAKGLWYSNLVDTEKVMDSFHDNCARVGYPTCALADRNGSTTGEYVRGRVENITNGLYHNPLPVIGPSPEVITYSDIKNLFFAAVYTPQSAFPWVATLLSEVADGNGTRFAELLKPFHTFTCPIADSSNFLLDPLNNRTVPTQEALMAVACSDGDDLRNTTRADFAQFLRNITNESPTIGPMWSMVHLHCIHYHTRTKYRFAGPWTGNTSHPLLFIGNTADPVTPLRNAVKFAKGFEGAVVLTQDSPGHCSQSTASRCTERHVRKYFQSGKLPAEEIVCEPDEKPFGPGPQGEILATDILREREKRTKMWRGILQSGGGFMNFGLGTALDLWLD